MKKLSFAIFFIIISVSSIIYAQNNELGVIQGIPADFPNDIPYPNNSNCLGHLSSTEGMTVTFESTDKPVDIFDFYKKELKNNGFSLGEDGDTLVSDTGGLIKWIKGKREVMLMISFNKEETKSEIVITYK